MITPAHAYDKGEQYWLTSEVVDLARDQAKQRLEQDPWVETIEERMNSMAEASIMDALTACFPSIDAQAYIYANAPLNEQEPAVSWLGQGW